jgi:hypothetical protein
MRPVEVVPRNLSVDIQSLDKSVYYAVIDEYVNRVSRHKGVLCIGQFGTIGTPGLSDIDLLVVCEDRYYTAITLYSQEFVRQSALHRYLFWHDVAVVPQGVVKYLRYIHSLENLRTVWGNSDILESCGQPDEIVTLFRNILWNSYFWSLILHLCQQDNVSLRLTLMLSKNAAMSIVSNYRLMGNEKYADIIALWAEQERQRILGAHPSEQSNLAKAYLWEAIQTLSKSDWDLSDWMTREGLSTRHSGQKKVWLSQEHVVVFNESYESSQKILHEHIGHTHVTYLPSFYYVVSCLIARPYLQLQRILSKIWDTAVAEHIENATMRSAARKWNEALVGVFNVLREAGADPECHELIVFPFNLKRPISTSLLRARRLINLVRKYL